MCILPKSARTGSKTPPQDQTRYKGGGGGFIDWGNSVQKSTADKSYPVNQGTKAEAKEKGRRREMCRRGPWGIKR